jgi:hypothetical protein
VALPKDFVDHWAGVSKHVKVGETPLNKFSKKELLAIASSAITQLDEMSGKMAEVDRQKKQLETVALVLSGKPYSHEN